MKLRLFWILWGFDALIGLIAAVFFSLGLVDGTVSSFNIGIWLTIGAVLAVVLGGGLWLKQLGHLILGNILLLVLAIPGLLCVLFIVLFVVTDMTWN